MHGPEGPPLGIAQHGPDGEVLPLRELQGRFGKSLESQTADVGVYQQQMLGYLERNALRYDPQIIEVIRGLGGESAVSARKMQQFNEKRASLLNHLKQLPPTLENRDRMQRLVNQINELESYKQME